MSIEDRSWREADVIDLMRARCGDSIEALNFADDAAIFPRDEESSWLISKDICTDGIHFRYDNFSPQEIAHKVFHTTVSDIAAMGGVPHYILLGLSLPQGISMTWVRTFIDAFCACAKANSVRVIGGDTTRSLGPLFCSATVIGVVEKMLIKKRSGAQDGNLLAIVGNFGHAALGLRMLKNETLAKKYPELIAAQKTPMAQLEIARILAHSNLVTAMLDVSDGIMKDAHNLAHASGLAAHIDVEKIPISLSMTNGARELDLEPLKIILEGGEDYGLMVALNDDDDIALTSLIRKAQLIVIGTLKIGVPAVILEHAPTHFINEPPCIFEHGG